MKRSHLICGAALSVAVLGLAPARAAEGPCTNDIAQLGRQLGTQVGMGAPVSEPAAGQQKESTPAQPKVAADTTAHGQQQASNTNRATGGSPKTVGGAAGPVGAAVGSSTMDAVATGQIATSPEDVRRQSEGRPTTAAQAANPQSASASSGANEDRVSQAKMVLQRAVDLNAKGDASCRNEIARVRELMQQH